MGSKRSTQFYFKPDCKLDDCQILDLDSAQPWTWETLANSQLPNNEEMWFNTCTKIIDGEQYIVYMKDSG